MSKLEPRLQFEQWVQAHGAELYRFAYRLSGSHQITEDLVQETYVEAWKSVNNLHGPAKARAWLFQILRFRYAHFIRDGKRRMQASALEGVDAPDPTPAATEGQRHDRADRLVRHARITPQICGHELTAALHDPPGHAVHGVGNLRRQPAAGQHGKTPRQIPRHHGPARRGNPGHGPIDDEIRNSARVERGIHRADDVEERIAAFDAAAQGGLEGAHLRGQVGLGLRGDRHAIQRHFGAGSDAYTSADG